MKPVNRNEPPAEAPSKAGKEQKAAKKGAPKAKRPASETQRLRLSVLCGVLAALTFASLAVGGWQLSQALAIRDSYQADLVSAVTLTADVAAGEVIEAGDVTVSEVPSAFAPADRATETSEVVGLRANSNLTAGNAVSLSSLQASSDPATLARDLKRICAAGYLCARIQPVDMFPQSGHVETVVLMSKVKE